MKYWFLGVLALLVVVDVTFQFVVGEAANNITLITHASKIFDLQFVLGPKYVLLVLGYWRYLESPCSSLAKKMAVELETGVMEKYCNVLTRCPENYPTQSCMVQITAYTIWWSCCKEFLEVSSTDEPAMTTQRTTPPNFPITATRVFDLKNRQRCSYGKVIPSGKIFGGTEAKRGEFPWMIMLRKNGDFLCGGMLLDTTHVLTTAHCFDSDMPTDRYEVIAGKHSLHQTDSTEQRIAVKSFRIHEDYNTLNAWNDIALLVLAQPLIFNEWVVPACLPSTTDKLDQYCTVAGWGMTEGEPPSVLMKVELETYNRSSCQDVFRATAVDLDKYLYDGAICAANGKLGGKDACRGDSGSPLMCVRTTQTSAAWFVVGIVSNGNNCALPGDPGIYVNLQHYLSWINTTTLSMF